MSVSAYKPNDVDIDLRQLFSSLLSNWWRILMWSLMIAALAFAAAWMATPKYRAEARIFIEPRESAFTRPDTGNRESGNVSQFDEEGIVSQVEIIASTKIMKEVAQKLELHKLQEFDEAADMSIVDRVLILTGLVSDPNEIPADERVLKRFNEKLNVYRVEKSRVIAIEFSSTDPKLAAAVPNAIAEAYMAENSGAKMDSNSEAATWLQAEITDLSAKVKSAEAKVADFRAKSDLLTGNNQSVLANQQLSDLSTELSRVRASRATAEATAAAVRQALQNGASIDSLPKVIDSPLIQRLRERQVQLKADIADLSTTLLGNHPRIRALNSQLADMDAQIRDEAQNILRSLSTEAETARAREAQLVTDLNRQKVETSRAGEDQVELRALEREATAQRELLESYLTRYREASSRGDARYLPADARIIATALVPPEPYFPKILPIVAAAFFGSILLIAIGTLLKTLFSGSAMRYQDGSAFAPQAVHLEPAEATAERLVPANYEQPARRVPSSLGEIDVPAAVEKLIDGGIARAIFISPEGDDGAAASVMTAREAADKGLHVLMFDLTASGAASATMLEDTDQRGITDLLTSEAQFADIIHSDHFSEAHVVPNGTADAARAMRAADRLPMVLTSLGTVYDLIVIECGSANSASIRRLVAENTALLVSVLDPEDAVVSATADELRGAGYESILLVSPEGYVPPSPVSGRNAA